MTVPSRDTKGTTLAAVWKSNSVQRQASCEPWAAPGLPQTKAQTQSCCPWKEARASQQFTPPASQPCSHTLYLTTSNRCANPSLDLHHPSGRVKPHGFSGVRLKVTHTRTARWCRVSKAWLLALSPALSLPIPGNTEPFVGNPPPHSGDRAGRAEVGRAGGELRSICLLHASLRLFLPPAEGT